MDKPVYPGSRNALERIVELGVRIGSATLNHEEVHNVWFSSRMLLGPTDQCVSVSSRPVGWNGHGRTVLHLDPATTPSPRVRYPAGPVYRLWCARLEFARAPLRD